MTRLRDDLGRGEKEIYKQQFTNPEQNKMEMMKYNNAIDRNEEDNNWKCKEVLEHQIKGNKNKQDIEVKCCWDDINQTTSW